MFTFDHETHIGKVGDVVYPSVTQLITEFKLVDYDNVPDDRLEYKRVLGTLVDKACEYIEQDSNYIQSLIEIGAENALYCVGNVTVYVKDLLPYVNGYKKFREIEKHDIDIEKSLKRIVSKKWRFHGAPDLVYRINESDTDFGIIDRKCTWTLYPSGEIQVYLYKMLIEEVYKVKVRELGLLRLNNNGNYEYKPVKDKTLAQDAHCLIYLHHRKVEKYNIKERMYLNDK